VDEEPAVGEVRSADGTAIGFRRAGVGPAVVLLHGAGQSSVNLVRLATALSLAFTVLRPQSARPGRSGPHGDFRGLGTELEDFSALLDACGATRMLGLSAGAVIAVEAALARPDVIRQARYEPPLTFGGVVHGDWAPAYERQLAAGRPGAALVTVLKATADRTSPVRWIPRRPLGAALDFAVRRTAGRPRPTARCRPASASHRGVRRPGGQRRGRAAGAVRGAVVRGPAALDGSRSARNLTASLDGLSRVLPHPGA
jgi:pimeloyl-ACP methyl ester carboxylesterase